MTALAEDDRPLTAEEVLTFGPVVEAQVWTPVWVQEARAPIARAAGRPKLGPIFNSDGVGKAVIIRPCMSRGRRVRGLRPVYTQRMLESNSRVFSGWPMFMDHLPPELASAMQRVGRSVKDLGGQVLESRWDPTFVHEDDGQYGYQKGAVVGDVWASPVIRETVGENPNLLHTSINAWPTSGKPGPVPWRPALKGMVIEGIRSQPQGSVDYVVRGGAGGRLLVAEGVEDEGAWPEVGEWNEDDVRLVVSLAESVYASRHMSSVALPSKPEEFKDWLTEHAPHLLPALTEGASEGTPSVEPTATGAGLSEEQVRSLVTQLLEQANGRLPTVEEFESRIREEFESTLEARDRARVLSEQASALIESAENLPVSWKARLKARYAVQPSGAPETLVVSESDTTGEDGKTLSEWDVVEARVVADIEESRELIREAQGKPRVTGQGGAAAGAGGDGNGSKAQSREWLTRMAGILGESEEDVAKIYGLKVEESDAS